MMGIILTFWLATQIINHFQRKFIRNQNISAALAEDTKKMATQKEIILNMSSKW